MTGLLVEPLSGKSVGKGRKDILVFFAMFRQAGDDGEARLEAPNVLIVPILLFFLVIQVEAVFLGLQDRTVDAINTAESHSDQYIRPIRTKMRSDEGRSSV